MTQLYAETAVALAIAVGIMLASIWLTIRGFIGWGKRK
jgi:hypothetical protein